MKKEPVLNYEQAPAYQLSHEWDLYATVVTSNFSHTFYEAMPQRLERLRELIEENDPQFVAHLAVYAREEMNLRSIPLILTVELAKIHIGDLLLSRLTARVIQRADEITELLAYYQLANGREKKKKLNRLSKQLQAGLQKAFNKFDEYQFAKYNRKGEIKLRDALFLVHPKAKDEAQQLLFDKIAGNSLQTPYTWETELSDLGKKQFESEELKQEAFTQKWEELIDSNKVGYMALLRNLRNILQANVSNNHIDHVCQRLASKEHVLTSKQMPFRFLAAYRELSEVNSGYTSKMMDALENAVQVSAGNIAGFDASTRVLIACDVSSSMWEPISERSKIMNYDIGLMLAMLLKSRCKNVVSGIFGDTWKVVNLPSSGILSNVDAFYQREGEVGYSTNGHLVIANLIERGIIMDKIMVFTDGQLWNSSDDDTVQLRDVWKQYKKLAPQAKLYLFDLAGYGLTPLDISNKDVYLIAGWSDKIFDMLDAIDRGINALKAIKAIKI
ncbi:MAG: TROVE domain-containing protein [Tannerellaceae bacterium]|jgi:hypothetical protein|nr:TROVE domain-containing protein [Tannerellaceae bacterium]